MPARPGDPTTCPAAPLESAVAEFRARLWATGRAALRVNGAEPRWYAIGGWPVCVRFAGEPIRRALAPALQHLETTPAARPALSVTVWDDATTGLPLPPPPFSLREAFGPLGEIRGLEARGCRAAFDVSTGALSGLDIRRGDAVYRVPDAHRVAWTDRAAPLRIILHWWAGARGGQLVHAGAVGRADGAILLLGRSGAGKSTTALACLGSSLRYLGDDYCLLRPDPEPRVFSLYATAKVDGGTLRRLPHVAAAAIEGHDAARKAVLLVGARWPDWMLRESPVRAIVLPRITGRTRPRLRRASGGDGLLAGAPSTMFQLPGRAPDALGRLAELARRVPTFVLEVGAELAGVAACLESCLQRVGRPTALGGADG